MASDAFNKMERPVLAFSLFTRIGSPTRPTTSNDNGFGAISDAPVYAIHFFKSLPCLADYSPPRRTLRKGSTQNARDIHPCESLMPTRPDARMPIDSFTYRDRHSTPGRAEELSRLLCRRRA